MRNEDLINIIELHGKEIYRFCYQLVIKKEDADDLYQETFLKAMELHHRIDMDNNPKGFLISIAIGLWKNQKRKYAWRQRIAPTNTLNEDIRLKDEPIPEDIIISNEISVTIQRATGELSDKFRIPLYMYYVEDMSIKEIATMLRIPQGTVKSRLYKARKDLKDIMEGNDYE